MYGILNGICIVALELLKRNSVSYQYCASLPIACKYISSNKRLDVAVSQNSGVLEFHKLCCQAVQTYAVCVCRHIYM